MFLSAPRSAFAEHPLSGFWHTNTACDSRFPGVVKPHAEHLREVFGAGT
jgi:hypothetical protein